MSHTPTFPGAKSQGFTSNWEAILAMKGPSVENLSKVYVLGKSLQKSGGWSRLKEGAMEGEQGRRRWGE